MYVWVIHHVSLTGSPESQILHFKIHPCNSTLKILPSKVFESKYIHIERSLVADFHLANIPSKSKILRICITFIWCVICRNRWLRHVDNNVLLASLSRNFHVSYLIRQLGSTDSSDLCDSCFRCITRATTTAKRYWIIFRYNFIVSIIYKLNQRYFLQNLQDECHRNSFAFGYQRHIFFFRRVEIKGKEKVLYLSSNKVLLLNLNRFLMKTVNVETLEIRCVVQTGKHLPTCAC